MILKYFIESCNAFPIIDGNLA